jgi:ParB family chromosome partitioning protein
MDAQQLVLVDVKSVKPAKDNPRTSVGDVKELAASMAAVGMLEPIVATKKNGSYEVVAGSRRLAAAKLAGLKDIPVIVRDFTIEQRQEAMLIENLQRSDLTPLEEAHAFERLLALPDYTQRKLAERIGRNQSHISKRLTLLKLTPKTQAALDAGGITLDGALELTRLAEHPKVMDEVLRDERGRIDSWRISRELEALALQEKIAKATAELQSKGTKIIGWEKKGYNAPALKGKAVPVTEANEYEAHVKMAPAVHAKEPCHAAAISQRDGKPFEVCTAPTNHEKAYVPRGGLNSSGRRQPGGMTDKEKANRRAKREHNKAIVEAQAARWEFLRYGFTQRLPASHKDRALRMLVGAWSEREIGVSYDKIGRSAVALLGLTVKETRYSMGNARGTVAGFLKTHPGELLRVALAVGIGAIEDGIRPDIGYSSSDAWKKAGDYFAWLKELGYEISDAERLELAGKAPK